MAHPLVGGFGAVKPVDDEVTAVFGTDSVKAAIAREAGAGDQVLVAYKTQVVAGVNFLAHVKVSGKDFLVKVHRPLPHMHKEPEVMNVEEGSL